MHIFFFFFFSLILCFVLISSSQTLEDDKKALLDFLSHFSSSHLLWNQSSPVCHRWTGVTCNANRDRVVSVRLPAVGFNGLIPPFTISRLSSLKVLSLRKNHFTGDFPSDFINLNNLTHLYLQHNRFSGPLPSILSELKNLKVLDLSNNGFNGSIPASLSGLTSLRVLNLANNSFSGEIPDLDLPKLSQLNLSNNKLIGTIPKSLQRFQSSAFSGRQKKQHHKLPFGLNQVAFLLILAAACVLGVFGFSFIMIACCLRKKCFPGKLRKRDSSSPPPGNWTSRDDNTEEGGKIIYFGGRNHSFDLDDLLTSSAEVLGKGAFGATYMVTMEDMSTVVVKRLKEVVVGRREFEQQMEIIGMIRHENVAELKAYYYSKDDKLAVYSYYSQGSLFEMLHGIRARYQRVPLDWDARLRIATGAVRGLAKIHEGNNGKLIHGNIKSSNIFLDSQCYGCIGDLGLTTIMRSLPQTTCLTSGYQAPEITDTRRSTQISDVYSFGVVLLELLTGKSPVSPAGLAPKTATTTQGESMDLASWIRNVVANEWTGEVFDMEILSQSGGFEEEMVEMLQIGLACVALKQQDRPHISQVLKMIEDIRSIDAE
ncbi:PREDICTED: putative inactive receptor-like protein kinase At1g64210 [Camelina sativa]|uniref:Inactive receptor-like protein kinase At1g64210 n=1 Tax=Camelina sativa TaxID=90675 RepID=A0ABM0SZP9_CAMSA|nr:PREDICTED: putative inactive receptor-like protein kinase At1g64210 [Camelina sativa]